MTNHHAIRILKREHVQKHTTYVTERFGMVQPHHVAQGGMEKLWHRVGEHAIMARIEWDKDRGLNIAICQGMTSLRVRHVDGPGE